MGPSLHEVLADGESKQPAHTASTTTPIYLPKTLLIKRHAQPFKVGWSKKDDWWIESPEHNASLAEYESKR